MVVWGRGGGLSNAPPAGRCIPRPDSKTPHPTSVPASSLYVLSNPPNAAQATGKWRTDLLSIGTCRGKRTRTRDVSSGSARTAAHA
eukprot:2758896-Rhodomonas_salina.4